MKLRFFVCLVGIGLLACGPQNETAETQASAQRLGPQVVWISGVPGEWHFGIVSAIAVRNDTIWVADRAEKKIHSVSFQGELLYQFGGEGDGPGEFRQPIALRATSDGSIWVLDAGNARVTRYSSDGRLIDSRPLPYPATSFEILEQGDQPAVVTPGPSSDQPLVLTARDSARVVSVTGIDGGDRAIPWPSPGRVLVEAVEGGLLLADGFTGRIWRLNELGNSSGLSEVMLPARVKQDNERLRDERVASLNVSSGQVLMPLYSDLDSHGGRLWIRPLGVKRVAVEIFLEPGPETSLIRSAPDQTSGLVDLVWLQNKAVAAYPTEIRIYRVLRPDEVNR